mmetsp:Transcript_93142/g.263271  ORF Transcript_93142/g.263271 Transcript_93142/m.263271 type:complete len:208 (-) Transcript_93142:1279-1902(-)
MPPPWPPWSARWRSRRAGAPPGPRPRLRSSRAGGRGAPETGCGSAPAAVGRGPRWWTRLTSPRRHARRPLQDAMSCALGRARRTGRSSLPGSQRQMSGADASGSWWSESWEGGLQLYLRWRALTLCGSCLWPLHSVLSLVQQWGRPLSCKPAIKAWTWQLLKTSCWLPVPHPKSPLHQPWTLQRFIRHGHVMALRRRRCTGHSRHRN